MKTKNIQQIDLDEFELALYADAVETQFVRYINSTGILIFFYEYGTYYKEEFKLWDNLSDIENKKVEAFLRSKETFNPDNFTKFSKRNLQVIQNFLLYAGLEDEYSQTAIDYIAEDHVDGEDSDSAHREIALGSELIREDVEVEGAKGKFSIFANHITELIYGVSDDESEYVRLYKLTKPQEVIEVEHRDEILDYCLAKKTPDDEVCIGDIFVHGKYVEQLN